MNELEFWLTFLFWWMVISIVTSPIVGRVLRKAQASSSSAGGVEERRAALGG
jgi:hypothetical protein